jgi:hypothetical protein
MLIFRYPSMVPRVQAKNQLLTFLTKITKIALKAILLDLKNMTLISFQSRYKNHLSSF